MMAIKAKKPTSAALQAATDDGMDARSKWQPGTENLPECPYEPGPLMTAWENGWRGQREFERNSGVPGISADEPIAELGDSVDVGNIGDDETTATIRVNDASGKTLECSLDSPTPEVKVAIGKIIQDGRSEGVQQLEDHGHNVTDEEVEFIRDNLAGLMTAFDDLGVQIVEEQWRGLSDNERTVSAGWANNRRTGGTRPCPDCLMPFANDRLKQEFVDHVEKQVEFKTSLVSCEYGKPSRSKIDEGGQYRTSIKFRIPLDQVQPGRALEMWGDVKIRAEFGDRSTLDWKGERLPGMEDVAGEIFECEVDVLKYSWTKTGWVFGFSVSEEVITIDQANGLWDGVRGSIKITPIGVPETTPKQKEEESTAEMIAKARPLPSANELPFETQKESELPQSQRVGAEGEFWSPEEFMVPSHVKGCSAIVTVGNSNGRYFASGECVFRDTNDVSQDANWGQPKKTNGGYATLTQAVIAMLGTLIDEAMKRDGLDAFVADLRKELNRLTDGGEPYPIPE